MLTITQLVRIVGVRENENMRSFMAGLEAYGGKVGVLEPHRLAQYVPQCAHESMGFVYDREIWDGRGAQARYDTRTDLGNTPEVDGDGFKNRGRGPIMITGGHNIREFETWARTIDKNAPDFSENPDLINTDPWEGLSPLWFWDTRNLNKYADQGDNEMVTRVINGGLNGYADRLRLYDRTALILLGYEPIDVVKFQRAHDLVVDGISGPKTRAAMHRSLKSVKPSVLDPAEEKLKLIAKVIDDYFASKEG